jgi:effector-binding domain-containing protein
MRKNILVFMSFLLFSSVPLALAYPINVSQTQAVTLQPVEPFVYFCIHHKGPFTQVEEVIGKLMQEAGLQNIIPAGALMGVYYNNPAEVKPEDLEWEMGFPVTAQALVQPPLERKEWNFALVATFLHKGSYETTGETVRKILDWMESNGYIQAGPILERYLDMNPSEVKPEDLKTEIWIPVKKNGESETTSKKPKLKATTGVKIDPYAFPAEAHLKTYDKILEPISQL